MALAAGQGAVHTAELETVMGIGCRYPSSVGMTVGAGLAETVRDMRRRGDAFVFGCGNASSCMTVVTVAVAGACGNGLSGDMAFRAGGPDGSMSTAE